MIMVDSTTEKIRINGYTIDIAAEFTQVCREVADTFMEGSLETAQEDEFGGSIPEQECKEMASMLMMASMMAAIKADETGVFKEAIKRAYRMIQKEEGDTTHGEEGIQEERNRKEMGSAMQERVRRGMGRSRRS